MSNFFVKKSVVSAVSELDELINQDQLANSVFGVYSATHRRRENRLYPNVMECLQIGSIVNSMGWYTMTYPVSWKKGNGTSVPNPLRDLN
tara:strand:+ start:431 stop:700 length:270 start_codon:yes stop_codon:yes gene_type:complete